MPVEEKEKKLFDEIALKYSCKDTYPVSAAARRFQFDTLLDIIPKDRSTEFNKIIEIGCGNGAGAEHLKDLYGHYTGIDISSKLIQIAKKNYASENANFFCSDILQFEEKTKYDLIVCVGVLHHLPDLKKYLNKISDMGHKNSIFLFLEPQSQNPLIQFMRMIRKFTDHSYSKDQIFFKRSELEKILKASGLKIIKSKYTGYFTPPLAQVIMKPEFIFLPLIKFLTGADRIIQRSFSNPFSWNISIAAERDLEK